ncbi:hypothetical protein [Sorangium sp. So ce1024]|uniref:hypothetical protein n=1 Tax=Sorangium sp. So ce1024 TaxID=3133327 RepID=UPI003F082416
MHRRRPFRWQDVAGRPVCDDDCAELERLRQSVRPNDARVLLVQEIDGEWIVDQPVWSAEHRRVEA